MPTYNINHGTLARRRAEAKETLWPARILALRQSRGETQAAFAASIGVAVPTVSHWEMGRNVPTPVIRRLIEAMEKYGAEYPMIK